jgi:hypothetical protein
MSYITFDYICPNCGAEYPNSFVKRAEMDERRSSLVTGPRQRVRKP